MVYTSEKDDNIQVSSVGPLPVILIWTTICKQKYTQKSEGLQHLIGEQKHEKTYWRGQETFPISAVTSPPFCEANYGMRQPLHGGQKSKVNSWGWYATNTGNRQGPWLCVNILSLVCSSHLREGWIQTWNWWRDRVFPVAVGWGSLVKVTWSIRQLLLSVALLNGGESIDLNTLKIVRSVCGRLKIRCYSENSVIQSNFTA